MGKIYKMNQNIKINEFLDWLESEAEHFIQNPQVNHTYNNCALKLKEVLQISKTNRLECTYGTCNKPAGHSDKCNQF